MYLCTIEWKDNQIKLIDQTRLPRELKYVYIKEPKAFWQAIKTMKVRGAPALGAAAGLGVYLGIKNSRAKNFAQFKKEMDKVSAYIGSCRPTARNLFWGLERMRRVAYQRRNQPIPVIKQIIFREAQNIIAEDRMACRNIGRYGAELIKNNDTILTICNAGILATIDYGTALGVIYRAHEQKKRIKVFACETRPMLQGARLTSWELQKKGIDVTLICDSMAADLMRQGRIKKVIAGADRIAANGDTANKIGTYSLAVLSRYHKIPFYIAAPASTFDPGIRQGKDIVIEQRNGREVTELFFKQPIAPKEVKVFNPAFDVTPRQLIAAIITEKGVIRPPYKANIKKILIDATFK
ncbi:MAG: S-methyl-5-thioribose-1-phosphate isomerase [Candidatus Omnitrophica bacterium]|nr:S-methyl-5-thioribose-1-phosphate isomerase [Candidatus Omnitrophota bacterium]